MPISKTLLRERTNTPKKQTIVFTAPGIYYPPYGKTAFLLQAQGAQGNSPMGGTVSTTNANSGGTYLSGGNVNAASGGTVAVAGTSGTNPVTGHNYVSGGNTNVASGGTVLANASYVQGYANQKMWQNYTIVGYATSYAWTVTLTAYPPLTTPTYIQSGYLNYLRQWKNYSLVAVVSNPITNPTYYNPYVAATTNPTVFNPYVPGNAFTNPTYYNPYTAAYTNPTYYNPYVAGTANPAGNNPATGGNYAGTNAPSGGNVLVAGTFVAATGNTVAYNNIVYYNPYTTGTNYTNPYVAGTTAYTPFVAGNVGSSTNVLGVTLPGGAAGTSAPTVGFVTVAVSYSNAGTPITVPTGGYVKIQNT